MVCTIANWFDFSEVNVDGLWGKGNEIENEPLFVAESSASV